jgi:hypothetical protein
MRAMAAETAAVGGPSRKAISLWAIASLVCAILFVCPIAPVLGLVLGAIAIIDVRRKGRSGARMVIAAMVVSVLSIGGWVLLAGWWNTHARRPMLLGPVDAIVAGQGGDTGEFLAAFLGDDTNAERDAIEFLATVTGRYGLLKASSQREDDHEVTTLRRAAILYEFQFETGPVDAEAEFVLSKDGGGLVLKFAWVVIRDPVEGDVRYPATSLSAP